MIIQEPARRREEIARSVAYSEYSGGLGDMINYIYWYDAYVRLDRLSENERAFVALMVHNPCATELFRWHPKSERISVADIGFFWNMHDPVRRATQGLPEKPPPGEIRKGDVHFYPSPSDLEKLRQFDARRPYIVLSPSARTRERDVPYPIVDNIVRKILTHGFVPVIVGRNYSYHFDKDMCTHEEIRPESLPGVVNMIDQLSVPGTARLVEGAAGSVAAFSVIMLLSWHLHKPVCFFTPNPFESYPKDHEGYFFGRNRPETLHMTFAGYSSEKCDAWLKTLKRV